MKYLVFFLLAAIVGCFSFLGYVLLFIHPVIPVTSEKKTLFSFTNPPSESVKGDIISMSGEVAWQSRTATQAAIVTKPQKIQQGEELFTEKNGKVTVLFEQIASISAQQNSDISFAQTIPAAFVVNQQAGDVIYEKLGTIPLQVRSLDLVTSIDTGNVQVSLDVKQTYITVFVASGSATVGFDDRSFTSHTENLTTGDSFVFSNITKKGFVE